MENDFLVVKEKSKDKLLKISKDIYFLTQAKNFYPDHGRISKLTYFREYAILFICDKK